jgi:transcriptional regulator with XRE-family HTH domain
MHKCTGGLSLDHLNTILAQNLKKIREEKKLSLDKVAKLTGVSKSMLGQIERGETNPTISTVWKIANGMKVSFTSLINQPQLETQVIKKGEIEALTECNGKYVVYPFFPYEEGRRFEIYKVDIEKGGYLDAEAHNSGAYEFITVFEGELTIRIGDEEYTIRAGEAIKFKADRKHFYHNSGEEALKISMVIYYE